MLVSNFHEVKNFIPQRNPILMVDNLICIVENTATTTYKIKESIFTNDSNIMNKYGLIEHVAQSSALFYGYLHGKSFGMIGKIKDLQICDDLIVDSLITSKISIIKEIGNLVSVITESYHDQEIIMKSEMLLNFEKNNE
jgi:3-hydroxymyristoyl/3-hydroxydecanoyl-(acyl carrier protein) dehydratase